MKFSEVIGQEQVKQRLMQMVHDDRVPHAIMLCGPAGCGKKALALAFASYLLGEREDDSIPATPAIRNAEAHAAPVAAPRPSFQLSCHSPVGDFCYP